MQYLSFTVPDPSDKRGNSFKISTVDNLLVSYQSLTKYFPSYRMNQNLLRYMLKLFLFQESREYRRGINII